MIHTVVESVHRHEAPFATFEVGDDTSHREAEGFVLSSICPNCLVTACTVADCASCPLSAAACTKCTLPKVLHDNMCIDKPCPDGFGLDPAGEACGGKLNAFI